MIFNWEKSYASELSDIEKTEEMTVFHLENETGQGDIIYWDVLPGIQAVYYDLRMFYCNRPTAPKENIIMISCCLEGRHECKVSDNFSFYTEPGDFSVGIIGRQASRGEFPTGRYRSLVIIVAREAFDETTNQILSGLKIDIDRIVELTNSSNRYYLIRGTKHLDILYHEIAACSGHLRLPMITLKVLEILLRLCDPNLIGNGDAVSYLSRTLRIIAEKVHERVTEDISRHITIDQLAEEFDVSSTTIKKVFKKVYGMSVYAYQKTLRLQNAHKLLRETDRSVAEIAMEIGYINPGKFAAAFKEQYGLSPSEFKKGDYLELL